jgi:osmotically-inducible protein OsmY
MSDDAILTSQVLAELAWEPSVTEAHIGVTAHDGIVTLTGHVESLAEKRAAEAAVRRVKGVRALAEEIEVRLPDDRMRSDDEIAAMALARLSWDGAVPTDGVAVTVEKGWLTLTGEVDWYYRKMAAERDMRLLPGLLGVTNEITVKPRANPGDIGMDIMHALGRRWFLGAREIAVSAEGGAVRLSGSVLSLADSDAAEAVAWASYGVTSVDNEITVA